MLADSKKKGGRNNERKNSLQREYPVENSVEH